MARMADIATTFASFRAFGQDRSRSPSPTRKATPLWGVVLEKNALGPEWLQVAVLG